MKNAYGTFLIGACANDLEIDYLNGENEKDAMKRVISEALERSGIHCDWIESTSEVSPISQ